MPFLSRVLNFWKNLIHRRQVEQDLNDELNAYVDELVERRVEAGASAEAAREAALIELGEIEKIRDLVRQQRVGVHGLRIVAVVMVVAAVAFSGGAWFGRSISMQQAATVLPEGKDVVIKREPVVLEGRVIDKKTGQPVPYVQVGLEPGSLLRRYTYTDETGHFEFRNPPPQGYHLSAGTQSWGVGGFYVIDYPGASASSTDEFMLFIPNSISVVNKMGQPLEGGKQELGGITFKGTRIPDYRSFLYSQSVLELKTSNLPGGEKRASAFRELPIGFPDASFKSGYLGLVDR